MIQAKSISIAECSEAFLEPYLQQWGHLPIEQLPHFATLLNPQTTHLYYQFREDSSIHGYAIIKVRHRILADMYFGPVLLSNEHYTACIEALKRALRRRGLLLLRVFPPLGAPELKGLPVSFNWATSIVDISCGEAELLQSFSPNHRQSIRKAEHAGVSILDLLPEDQKTYSKGYISMFSKRGISKDPEEVEAMLGVLLDYTRQHNEEAFILTAHQPDTGKLVGGGIFLRSGDTCTYYQGYSEKQETALPILHLILWDAMKRARALGCTRFDLSGYSLDKKDKQLEAVNNFKRWFRGEIIHYPPTVMIPLYAAVHPMMLLLSLIRKQILRR